ncbi:MAG TPA: SdpI family protein [Gammaproteobacteria bacterium]|nr:SdpI family protein [Gammaproteobacteria bacterium]
MRVRRIDFWTGVLVSAAFVLAAALNVTLYRERGFLWPALGVFLPPFAAAAIWAWIATTTRHYPGDPGASSVRKHLRLTQIVVAALCVAHLAATLIERGGIRLPYGLLAPVLVGVAFVVLGNGMGRLRKNPIIGIRNAWTFHDDEVWLRTHRLLARVVVVGGLALVVTALVQPTGGRWVIGVAMILVVAALGVRLYSFLEFRKRHGGRRDQ